jgi:tetratricopeptide (TPR) repeat protein/transcriptional regulator with XRE-family HTH domain
VAEGPAPGFGGLLRRLRTDAGLTQEELAEAASLSLRSVSDLERGINLTARKVTAQLLAGALGLAGPERSLFEAAARGRVLGAETLVAGDRPAGSSAAARTLPRDIAGFTGRDAELGRLVAASDDTAPGGGVVGIHAIGGMAGIGKTTLAVHAAHRLAGHFPDGQMFLPLHAHTPGQRPVEPADALASLLLAAGVAAQQIPAGLDARAARWRDHLAGKKTLLVLDDAAGHEQVRPLLPGTAGSLVLITSRRRLAALEDAAMISLDTLPSGDAAALLARLSGRPELASAAGPAGEIARLCGYLPLAIGMLARQLHHHPAWTAEGLAADLAAARDRLELMQTENLSVAAAFGLSYRDLTGGQRRLFRRLGLNPGPDIDAYAAAALVGTSLAMAHRHLNALYDQHLITEPARGRYGLHDLIREHAQALAAADDPAACDAAVGRLLDYYLHTALSAARHIPRWGTGGPAPRGRPSACAPPISTPRQAIAWLEAERANLYASVGHAAASGHLVHAIAIPAAMAGFLEVRGYWDQDLVLLQTALAAACGARDRAGQAGALGRLGVVQLLTGDYPAALSSLTQALVLYRDLGDRAGQAYALYQLGEAQALTGDYPAVVTSFGRVRELCSDLGDQAGQAYALNGLGGVQWQTGHYPAAAASHQKALALFRDIGDQLGQGYALSQLGLVRRLTGDYPAAATSLIQALALYGALGNRAGEAFALNELGVVQRLTGDYPAATASNLQALEQFRDVGDPAGQAYALNELGVVQRLTGDTAAAAASHQQALDLFGDLGHLYGQAEAHNNLGALLSQLPGSHRASDHHARALAIARDIGATLEEARALEGIGRCQLQNGNSGKGSACLQQAFTIYQRIGTPDARRIEETRLDHHAREDNLAPDQTQ